MTTGVADPLTVFFERLDALGYLFADGAMTLEEFLDIMGDAAVQLVVGAGYETTFAKLCREADARGRATRQGS